MSCSVSVMEAFQSNFTQYNHHPQKNMLIFFIHKALFFNIGYAGSNWVWCSLCNPFKECYLEKED
jgi:hypothetical protein